MKENFELPGFMTAVSLLSSAEAFNRAAAVTSTEEHAQRIDVAKLAVHYPMLLCWDQLQSAATKLSFPWPLQATKSAGLQVFVRTGTKIGLTNLDEGGKRNLPWLSKCVMRDKRNRSASWATCAFDVQTACATFNSTALKTDDTYDSSSRHRAAPTWSPPRCTLSDTTSVSGTGTSAWFVDIGEKVFQHDTAPTTGCGTALHLSAARGEHLTFQIAVRSPAINTGVTIGLGGSSLGELDVKRAAFTNVTTAANPNSSLGVGLYPDPLLPLSDTVIFPDGASTLQPAKTAVFWLTVGPIPASVAAGVHAAQLSIKDSGGAVLLHSGIEVVVWNFTVPPPANASQWTEADPFGAIKMCNVLDDPYRESNLSHCPGRNSTDYPHNEEPCLPTSTVNLYWAEMARHRINRVAWMMTWDAMSSIGIWIADDTKSVTLDTAAFDKNMEMLIGMGYRDFRLPIPAGSNGASNTFSTAGGVNPNVTWSFANSTHFNTSTGRGWWGNHGGSVLGLAIKHITVNMFDNATLNTPSKANASLLAWQTQKVGDPVALAPEFVRLFKLTMEPTVKHLRKKGWIDKM